MNAYVRVAIKSGDAEQANMKVVLPAAWLHDCVAVAKNHPDRAKASTMAADKAIAFLASINYDAQLFTQIHHAIAAHSFSANIKSELSRSTNSARRRQNGCTRRDWYKPLHESRWLNKSITI